MIKNMRRTEKPILIIFGIESEKPVVMPERVWRKRRMTSAMMTARRPFRICEKGHKNRHPKMAAQILDWVVN